MGPKQADRTAADHWLGLGADLISFGRAFIANPDLIERLRTGLPVAPADETTYYQGGDAGYLTYSAYQHTA
jgi:N-ethylmaleimide reductase